ncbi:MAG: methionyl-tRNA formyltransferase [Treponema sp.]|nr:methionyl-tRNA formyltransferase [Treponema sp.]
MRVLFAGSPAIAVPSLEAVCKTKGIELIGVLTNPDTPKGRHGSPLPTEIGEAAQDLLPDAHETRILKPFKLDVAARQQVSVLKPDLLVSFAYGRIFGPKFLALFPLGGINIHPSLLPKYRGPSPIQAAILNRDSETGISIQTLAQQMDSGDILAAEKIQLTGRETSLSLGGIVSVKAAQMLGGVLEKIKENKSTGRQPEGKPQNHSEASYCSIISRDEGVIKWSESAFKIDAKIRAFDPWPLCRTIHNGRELFILEAEVYNGDFKSQGEPGLVLEKSGNLENGILIQTGDGILVVTKLQYQAKKALFWQDFLNGARNFIGSQLI